MSASVPLCSVVAAPPFHLVRPRSCRLPRFTTAPAILSSFNREREDVALRVGGISFQQIKQRKSRHNGSSLRPSAVQDNTLAHDDGGGKTIASKTSGRHSIFKMLDAYRRFSRLHTLQGTILSITSVSLLAVQELSDFSGLFFLGMLQAVGGAILANLYTVGINQLSDVEIDKVNKPYLPLASGEFSITTGKILTSTYALLLFWLGWHVNSWPLRSALLFWTSISTAYSVNIPLLRWKRSPTFVTLATGIGLGAIIPMLFHLHMQIFVFGRPAALSQQLIFVAGFMIPYCTVIALFKDIPDVEGDKLHGIKSFAMQFGQKPVFWFCICLIEMAYGFAILLGLSSTNLWSKSVTVLAHTILGFIFWKKATSVDPKDNEATESFYLYIWKLYYAEYMLLPFLRL